MRNFLLLILILNLSACGTREVLAPVDEVVWTPFNLQATTYTVKRGDTLYSIAFRYDADYRYLAKINRIRSPYYLSVGQKIKLRPGHGDPKPKVQQKSVLQKPLKYSGSSRWLWPVRGEIKSAFNPRFGQKGINIAARKGSRVQAAQAGVIAYAGNGLENYGNLIIIKHDNNYLTAYGNNARNLVREGQRVRAGQVIADLGVINRKFYGLHFEIRKNGKPVNPLLILRHSKK